MMLSTLIDHEILPAVQKPSRYLGTELNSVHKDPAEVDVRVCLCYPDLYDLALGNLGLLVLYSILNRRAEVWAERAYAPAPDLEAVLRQRGLPLFSVESRTPLRDFDLLGFTLQYELTYTNLLNMLDLGGVPLKAADRGDADPLVVAGGPGALNPAPLADFVDCFAIGDGEDLVLELVDAVGRTRGLPRDRRLRALAGVDGLYVPGISAAPVARRTVLDLDAAHLPTDYLVPFARQVHDRVSLEVLRGCTHGCRFCQAGMVTRPVRERSVETVEQAIRQTLAGTGYEGLALTSLNTCDHSHARALLARAVEIAQKEGADVSLPSLRLGTFSVDLADMVGSLRKTGLTFAPEAATDRLRAVIGKFIPDDELIDTTREVFSRGWDLVKLYFMIGLPTERDEDLEAIADLTNRVLREGRKVNRRARLNLSISTFVPKPHTPFQWERQIGIEETLKRQALLRGRLKKGTIKFGRHDAETSFLEGVFSRADRSIGEPLLAAFRAGCRLDGWTEHFDFASWQRAFDETGFDAEGQLVARPLDAALPWDVVDVLIDREWLIEEARRAGRSEWLEDCRDGTCHQCGVMGRAEGGCKRMLLQAREGRRAREADAAIVPPSRPEPAETDSPVRWKLRFQLTKGGRLRWLSHLELQNVVLRALRRARVPVAYSQGFHPHPKLALGSALGVGVESAAEFGDVVLTESLPPLDFVRAMNRVLPRGIRLAAAATVPLKQPALMAETKAETFRLTLPAPVPELGSAVGRALDAEELIVERWHKKKGTKRLDIRPMIHRLAATAGDELEVELIPHEGRSARPGDVLAVLGIESDERIRIAKTATRVLARGKWVSPLDDHALVPTR